MHGRHGRRHPRHLLENTLRIAIACLAVAAGSWATHAQDTSKPRGYLNLRGADTNPSTGIHDAWGAGLGLNLNRYVGLELAVDNFEKSVDPPGYPELGEYAVWAFIPQVRIRYPLVRNRLVPYVVGGVGGAFTQFNDRKPHGFGHDIETSSSALLGSAGVGLEYFVADNLSLGFELKYLASSKQEVRVDGAASRISASAPLMMVSLRIHYPEIERTPLAETRDPIPNRFYVGFRAGGSLPVQGEVFPGIKPKTEPPGYGNTLDQLFGLVVGLNAGRHLSAELSLEAAEVVLDVEGMGPIGEYATAAILPQIRWRLPLDDGRWVPYAITGLGAGYHEFNDRKPAGAGLAIETQPWGVAASVGAGLEYFLASNIAFNLETRYLFARGQSIRIDHGPKLSGNLDTLAFSIGLRIYFP